MKMLYSHNEINSRLNYLATDINELVTTVDGFGDAVCIPILQGSVPFFHDLSSYFCWNPVVDYVGASSYDGQDQRMIQAYKMPKRHLVQDKAVFLFDDILDTGNTINFFANTLFSMGAKEVIPVVLLKRKHSEWVQDPRINRVIVGFEIYDEWTFGYGMDDENYKGRTLKHILYNLSLIHI